MSKWSRENTATIATPLAVSTAAVTITIVALSMPLLLPFSMAHKYWFIIAVTPDISINEYDGCTLPS